MAKENPMILGSKEELKQFNMLSFLDGSMAENWQKVEQEFHKQVGNGKLFKDKFGACIGLDKNSKNFADELFDVLAKRKRIEAEKGITLLQLKEFWEELNKHDLDTRLQIFFDLCDKNDDNKISEKEVKTMLKWTASANNLTNIENKIESYAPLIVNELDPDGNGFIEIEHLELLVKELWYSEERKMLQSQDDASDSSFVRETIEFINENRKQIWVLALWIAINLGLLRWKFIEYKEKEAFERMGYCIGIAKGSAETLKFNMGLILFLACRGTLTWLRRSTFLSSIFPFDNHISFHRMVGLAISIATFVHMVMHLGCGFPILSTSLSYRLKDILGRSFESKQPSYSDLVLSVPGVTGILMVIIMAYCFTLAIPSLSTRKKRSQKFFHHLIGFNAFWYSHHLLFLLYVLMILHGYFKSLAWDWLNRTTWMYIIFPIIVYARERLDTEINELKHEVKVETAVVYSRNDLLALYLTKPQGFKYQSGMYLLLKCKDISNFEWHPFSITSAPEDDNLSVHIRERGDWTGELISRFAEVCEVKRRRRGISRQESQTSAESSDKIKHPQIFIQGPYGAPAQNYKNYDVLLLLGFGIGATPMISILKDVLNHIKINAPQSHSEKKAPRGNDKAPPKVPKKVYFYWVTRTQESFEWFKAVMDDVAEYDKGKVIEMHNHLSCIRKEGDAQSVFLTILQNSLGQKEDIISGSRIRARYGRPNWENVFSDLKTKHKGSDIGVFCCGASSADQFHNYCKKHSHDSTKFHFHAEDF